MMETPEQTFTRLSREVRNCAVACVVDVIEAAVSMGKTPQEILESAQRFRDRLNELDAQQESQHG